jgi:hypothetical protein
MNIDRIMNDLQDYQEEYQKEKNYEENTTPKLKFNIDLSSDQKNLIEAIVARVKNIGDTEENEFRKEKNKNNYLYLIELLINVKQEFLRQNMFMFMTSGFTPETEIPFYNQDTKEITKVTMKDLEFSFGSPTEEEEIPEEEINNIVSCIEQQKLKENEKIVKKKLPTAEDIKKAKEKYENLKLDMYETIKNMSIE